MPFSFKPDVTATEAPANPVIPPAVFATKTPGGSPMVNLADRPTTGEGHSLVEGFLYVVFVVMVIISISVFGYMYYLSSQVEAKKAALATYESELSGLPLDNMRKLSNRIKVINQLVKEHPSVNVAFLIVEAAVENPITFTKFDMRYSDNNKSYKLMLGGISPDYKTIAQQMDTYKRKPYSDYVSKIEAEGLQPDNKGRITFSLAMPVTITGLIPETFSLVDGASDTAAQQAAQTISTNPATTTPATTTPSTLKTGTTTPTGATKNASTTAIKP